MSPDQADFDSNLRSALDVVLRSSQVVCPPLIGLDRLPETTGVRVAFPLSGEPSLFFIFVLEPSLLDAMVAGMLGGPPAVDELMRFRTSMGLEFANQVCGCLKRYLWPETRMGLPSLFAQEYPPPDSGNFFAAKTAHGTLAVGIYTRRNPG